MQNLYDLLGVRPDDDAENVRRAFREAAKASHPDHHGGDPEAAARFSRIAQAYDTLRDEAKRAAYDELLEIQRRPLRAKLKRTVLELKRHIVTDLIVGVALASMLAGSYELFARMSQTPIHEAGGITADESVETAAIQPGDQSDATGRGRLAGATAPQMPILIPEMSRDESAANGRGSALAVAKGEPVLDMAVQTIRVVKQGSESDVPIDQAATRAGGSAVQTIEVVKRDSESDVPIDQAATRAGGSAVQTIEVVKGDRESDAPIDPAATRAGGSAVQTIEVVKGDRESDVPIDQAATRAGGLAVQTIEVVKGDSESGVPMDQTATKAGVDDSGKNQASEPPNQQMAPSGDVPFSAPEKPVGGQHLPSSSVAASDIKGDSKMPEPAAVTAGDVKHAAEIRGTVRPPAAARHRLPLQQASLESRTALESRNASACAGSQSCASDRPRGENPPPVFGVGF